MHLHAHLKVCVLDFGPISAFWTFPFEHFNDILESFSKNWVRANNKFSGANVLIEHFRLLRKCASMRNLAVHWNTLNAMLFIFLHIRKMQYVVSILNV